MNMSRFPNVNIPLTVLYISDLNLLSLYPVIILFGVVFQTYKIKNMYHVFIHYV